MKLSKPIIEHMEKLRAAYNATAGGACSVHNEYEKAPESFLNSPDCQKLMDPATAVHCDAQEVRDFTSPAEGKKFLDIGCGTSLASKRMHEWPSQYFGIDISPGLIADMRKFSLMNNLLLGGLWVTDASDLPFPDNTFDSAAATGVLDYYPIEYIVAALAESSRVLKSGAPFVIDMPNPDHPLTETMFQLEVYMGRIRADLPGQDEFEQALSQYFTIQNTEPTRIMRTYFATAR